MSEPSPFRGLLGEWWLQEKVKSPPKRKMEQRLSEEAEGVWGLFPLKRGSQRHLRRIEE